MNMLSKGAILEYQAIYKKQFGEKISYEEAQEQGIKLLRLFGLIYQPIPKSWLLEAKRKIKEKKNETAKCR